MKSILQKSLILVTLALFAFQAQAQTWTKAGWYKIGVPGQDLFMTIDTSSGNLVWAAALSGDAETQVWKMADHPAVDPNGFIQVMATITGVGNFTMCTVPENISGKNITITIRLGDPSTDTSAAEYGYDQFQRRKTSSSVDGNDALFIKIFGGEQGSRYGVTPTAAGDPVQFDGGGIDQLEFTFVRDIATASISDFDTSSVVITNPVKNELNIQGLTADVQQVSVYSLLGKQILSSDVNTQSTLSLDVSDLATGMYLVKFQGDRSFFTKKFIKQ